MSDFIPTFRTATPQKLSKQGWIDANEPQVILFQGMRGSGKGVAVDYVAEKLYQQDGYRIFIPVMVDETSYLCSFC